MVGRIASTTLVKSGNDVRAKLVLKTVEEAKRYGFPIFIVDGGSPDDFRQALRERGARIFDENIGRSMGAGRRQALFEASRYAAKDDAIIWMEPEKHPFVARLPAIVALMEEKGIDLVTPGRKNLDSYSPEQMHEEMFLTLSLQCITGLKWDFGFGPFIADHKALRYFLEYSGEYRDFWDSIWIPRLRIVAAGLRVEYVEVEYIHPAEQTKEETGNPKFVRRRLEQLNNMIPAFEKEAQELGLRK